MKKLLIFIIYVSALGLFLLVDWKLVPAVIAFGWAMNLENTK